MELCWRCFYLRVSKLVLCVVDVKGAQQLLHGFPAIHKRILGDGVGIQNAVTEKVKLWVERATTSVVSLHDAAAVGNPPLLELSIQDSIWESLPADPDALQNSVTPQLVQDQEGVNHTCKT